MHGQAPLTQRPPVASGLRTTLRALFDGWINSACTLVGLAVLVAIVVSLIDWALINAVWSARSDADCAAKGSGACWAVISDRYRIIFFGLYPYEQQWRSGVACGIALSGTCLSGLRAFWSITRLIALWAMVSTSFVALMHGGVFGLPVVATEQWGGFTLTVYLYASTVLLGFPMAVGLALLRRNGSGMAKGVAAVLVDGIRTLPSISILFIVAVLAPFVLPTWALPDKLTRLVLAFALVFACYEAEIVRAGLQTIPVGQDEAARALGLRYPGRVWLVLLPQGLKNTLPSSVNLFLSTFKETSIVAVIGFFEFTASAQAAYGNASWANAYLEVYLFVGLVYFLCTLGLASYGLWLERTMNVEAKRET